MALTVVRFSHAGAEPAWGVVFADKVAPLAERYATTGEFIEQGLPRARTLLPADAQYRLSELTLLSPITSNQQFLCQGLNYKCHVRESGMDPAKLPFNTLFTKAPSSITAARGSIIRPSHVHLLDYELELGVVIGRHISGPVQVNKQNLHEYAVGLTMVNDISARDVQLPQVQFYKGKSYRTFSPVGPYLVIPSADEWRKLGELHLRLSVNTDIRQDSYCREMIYHPEQTLTELSAIQDLAPGDLLATGTPAGCAAKAPKNKVLLWALKALLSERRKWSVYIKAQLRNPRYLKPGDEMVATIRSDDGALDLGEQRHQILQER
ncbi:fumarylacetoacetate hydrolase [Pokkaliibacter plantistimulans]|uniref:Fumarylacetoacetate hydrolase n=1 Tax=Pokkaliibacter plantistimulans TaxID=1635171 RepID=A0ABX5LWH6_9GAMM|nr:fumarylacetoacetate hydrolase family protein [Pokkaliibacter plantistimulans]PXF29070.1 fumarylacetoacetate hydrolase [Pokkaliibacter plantistimulans]